MFNIFRRKTMGQRIVEQAKEQFPSFLVATGFGLVGVGVTEGSRTIIRKLSAEKKSLPVQQPQQQG